MRVWFLLRKETEIYNVTLAYAIEKMRHRPNVASWRGVAFLLVTIPIDLDAASP